MFQAEIPAGTCKYKENEKGEIWIYQSLGFNIQQGERKDLIDVHVS